MTQDYEVWVMGAGGASPRRLTDTPAGSSSTQPSWLPDGSGLVFRRGPNRGTDVWRMAPDGTGQRALVTAPDDQWYPSVSPATGAVLFATTVTSTDRSIQVSDASGIRTLRDLPGVYDSAPAWSPDGSRIAFESDADGDMEIYVMDADGSDVRQLTRNAEHDEGPAFSPDGTKIVFTRGENDVATDIWTMNADGSGQRRLTTTAGRDESPDWQAVPPPAAPPSVSATSRARLTARARGRRVARRAIAPGTRTVRIRFSRAARTRLREARRVRLTLRLATARRTVTLRR